MTPELKAAAVEAVEKAQAEDPGALLKIKACRLLREATGAGLRDIVPVIDWALSQPRTTLTRAAKERAVKELAWRLTNVSMDFAYAIRQRTEPDIKRLRNRRRWLDAALVRLAMARTVD